MIEYRLIHLRIRIFAYASYLENLTAQGVGERNASFSTNDPEWRKTERSRGRFIICQKSRIVVQFPCKPPGKLSLTRGVVYADEALRAWRHHGGSPVKCKQCLLLRRPHSKRVGIRSRKPPTYFCSQRRCRFRAVVGQKVTSTGLRCL